MEGILRTLKGVAGTPAAFVDIMLNGHKCVAKVDTAADVSTSPSKYLHGLEPFSTVEMRSADGKFKSYDTYMVPIVIEGVLGEVEMLCCEFAAPLIGLDILSSYTFTIGKGKYSLVYEGGK
jgi:hypothetical protein